MQNINRRFFLAAGTMAAGAALSGCKSGICGCGGGERLSF